MNTIEETSTALSAWTDIPTDIRADVVNVQRETDKLGGAQLQLGGI